MPNLFSKYWYKDEPAIYQAGLFNLRDDDLSMGGQIYRREILLGKCGFCIAETTVHGYSARRAVKYLPNRCCLWRGFYLTCMALDELPTGPVSRGQSGGLRHKHYVVAEISSPAALNQAKVLKLPII